MDSIDGIEVALSWPNDIQAENFQWALLPAAEEFSGESQTDPQNVQEITFYDGLEPTTEYVFYLRNVCEGEIADGLPHILPLGVLCLNFPFMKVLKTIH